MFECAQFMVSISTDRSRTQPGSVVCLSVTPTCRPQQLALSCRDDEPAATSTSSATADATATKTDATDAAAAATKATIRGNIQCKFYCITSRIKTDSKIGGRHILIDAMCLIFWIIHEFYIQPLLLNTASVICKDIVLKIMFYSVLAEN